ncbi:MAG TPA: S24/S26 family peptidase, partial [Vicinamibacterales bacterium]|nr:S24/S26 family peptidase [Vicinamibacterales bacterium]
LASGTLVQFRAEGRSMHPTIRDGETITAAPVAITDVVRGDVLLCRHGGRVLAHRIVSIAGQGRARQLELRGDSQFASQARVGADDIVARIVSVERGGRSIALPGGWIAHRARLTVAWMRRTIARAIAVSKSVAARRHA